MNITGIDLQELAHARDLLKCIILACGISGVLAFWVPVWLRKRTSEVRPCPRKLARYRA